MCVCVGVCVCEQGGGGLSRSPDLGGLTAYRHTLKGCPVSSSLGLSSARSVVLPRIECVLGDSSVITVCVHTQQPAGRRCADRLEGRPVIWERS